MMLRPRTSLFRFMLLVVGTVLIPPTLALVSATVAVERLAAQAEASVVQAARTAALTRTLVDEARSMERHARQAEVLDDVGYRRLYASRRLAFLVAGEDLARVVSHEGVRTLLEEALNAEATAHATLDDPESTPEQRAEALSALADVTRVTRQAFSESTDAVAAASRQVAHDAQAFEHSLVDKATWAVPLVLVILLAALVLFVRPLRDLDDAIRALGAGELDRPIQIGGPDDLRELGHRLEWLRTRLLALESDRVRLFRHVSHELKTPLACIREGTQLLSDGVTGPTTEEQAEVLGILQTNAAELQHRIEDILRISEIRRGDTQVHRVPLDVADVVQDVVERHRIRGQALEVSLDVVAPPAPVLADRHKLYSVVDNLITNAVKFSPAGATIRVWVEPGGAEHRVLVEDEGPGVAPDERERIFEDFYQGRDAQSGGRRGTGLGLSIAREYARAHQGDVRVEDGERGARFAVTLPAGDVQ